MESKSVPFKAFIYTLLVLGAAGFTLPFVWMAMTSVKVDREIMSEGLDLMPMQPRPKHRSPHVDDHYFDEISGPFQEQLIKKFRALAEATGFELPAEINGEIAWQQIGRGLYKKMKQRLKRGVWESNKSADERVAGIVAAAREKIDRGLVDATFGAIYRELRLGRLQVLSQANKEQVLVDYRDQRVRLTNKTPGVAQLKENVTAARPYAAVHYDFRQGERLVLTQTFELDFPTENLYRIQLYVRPDDTWHELWLTVEKGGRVYRAERAVVLANFEWTQLTWQEPSLDDTSTKIKTWILLHEDGASPATQGDAKAKRLKLTFEFRQVGSTGAWVNKLEHNYIRVFDTIPLWRYLHVSVFLVIANIVLTLIFSSLVAYAFARLRWPGREFCFILLLTTMMIPPQVTMIPHFLIWKWLGAYNTLTPLFLPAAFGNAFFIFLLRQFMLGIPRDLEDAARVDGCGSLRIYWHIILPLIKPSLAAIAIFTFMGTWNDFIGPLIYISDQRLYPLSLGLYAFAVQVGQNQFALTMAASLIMTVPVIIVFFFAQKYFIQGVTLTGMKG